MRGLSADWQRWTRPERVLAVTLAALIGVIVPALLVLGTTASSG